MPCRLASNPMCPHNAGTWRLEGGPDGVSCTRVDAEPDATIHLQALGSLYLGGASAGLLTAAGLLQGSDQETVSRLHRMFHTDPEPFNSFAF